MKVYPEELLAADLYAAERLRDFPKLDAQQVRTLRERGQALHAQFRRHPHFHNTLNIFVLAGLLLADLGTLLMLPGLGLGAAPGGGRVLAAMVGVGALHGYLLYSFLNFTLHEGAGHRLLIVGSGRWARAVNRWTWNLARLHGGDPVHYREVHVRHHGKFATPEDGDFTNFVLPSRFTRSLRPLAANLPFNDFRTHVDLESSSRSHRLSRAISLVWVLWPLVVMGPRYGWGFSLGVMLLAGPWVAFTLDRLRDSTEHNLLPMDALNGTRNLGRGFWGWLVGGGPWGQPCHLSHHIAPSLPWYQQWRLHGTLLEVLRPEQRAHFAMDAERGTYLRFLGRAWREGREFEARARGQRVPNGTR
jgi:fatty acid desaturase